MDESMISEYSNAIENMRLEKLRLTQVLEDIKKTTKEEADHYRAQIRELKIQLVEKECEYNKEQSRLLREVVSEKTSNAEINNMNEMRRNGELILQGNAFELKRLDLEYKRLKESGESELENLLHIGKMKKEQYEEIVKNTSELESANRKLREKIAEIKESLASIKANTYKYEDEIKDINQKRIDMAIKSETIVNKYLTDKYNLSHEK